MAPTAARRGTVDTVKSCMEVITWPMLITSPTTMAANKIGEATQKAASMVRRDNSTTCAVFMAKLLRESVMEAAQHGTNHQVPAIHHHEQQNFQWRGNHHRR